MKQTKAKGFFKYFAEFTSKWVAFLGFLLIFLEVIWMTLPVAGFLYSTTFLTRILCFVGVRWVSRFFMRTDHPIGYVFVAIGAFIFIISAIQVYGSKLTKRGMVSGFFYRFVRHPQYLGFILVGFGFVILWPRYPTLLVFDLMIFLYVLLARNEERRMFKSDGEAYLQYLSCKPFFIPGDTRVFKSLQQLPTPLTLRKFFILFFRLLLIIVVSAIVALSIRAYMVIDRDLEVKQLDDIIYMTQTSPSEKVPLWEIETAIHHRLKNHSDIANSLQNLSSKGQILAMRTCAESKIRRQEGLPQMDLPNSVSLIQYIFYTTSDQTNKGKKPTKWFNGYTKGKITAILRVFLSPQKVEKMISCFDPQTCPDEITLLTNEIDLYLDAKTFVGR